MVNIAGAILAGGTSSRFGGKPKGLLELPGGETFIKRIAGAMKDAGIDARVICSSEAGLYAFVGIPVIPDLNPGCGPMGGIEAALYYFKNSADAVLFVPCDTPNVGAREIARLCEHFGSGRHRVVIAETVDGLHPLCCVVHVDTRDGVTRAVRSGRRLIMEHWEKFDAERVRFEDAERFFNVNSPADYEAVVRRLGGGPEFGSERARESGDTRESGRACDPGRKKGSIKKAS